MKIHKQISVGLAHTHPNYLPFFHYANYTLSKFVST